MEEEIRRDFVDNLSSKIVDLKRTLSRLCIFESQSYFDAMLNKNYEIRANVFIAQSRKVLASSKIHEAALSIMFNYISNGKDTIRKEDLNSRLLMKCQGIKTPSTQKELETNLKQIIEACITMVVSFEKIKSEIYNKQGFSLERIWKSLLKSSEKERIQYRDLERYFSLDTDNHGEYDLIVKEYLQDLCDGSETGMSFRQFRRWITPEYHNVDELFGDNEDYFDIEEQKYSGAKREKCLKPEREVDYDDEYNYRLKTEEKKLLMTAEELSFRSPEDDLDDEYEIVPRRNEMHDDNPYKTPPDFKVLGSNNPDLELAPLKQRQRAEKTDENERSEITKRLEFKEDNLFSFFSDAQAGSSSKPLVLFDSQVQEHDEEEHNSNKVFKNIKSIERGHERTADTHEVSDSRKNDASHQRGYNPQINTAAFSPSTSASNYDRALGTPPSRSNPYSSHLGDQQIGKNSKSNRSQAYEKAREEAKRAAISRKIQF